MTVYGVLTSKNSISDPHFVNRYFCNVLTVSDALAWGENIIAAESELFGSTVLCDNVHAWLPNSNPRVYLNSPQNIAGQVAAGAPTSGVPCVQIIFPSTVAAYASTKNYRVTVNPAEQNGRNWNTAVINAVDTFLETLSGYIDVLCDKDGNSFGSPVFNPEVQYMQLGKRWYNRTS
jgi:hypothetical protein